MSMQNDSQPQPEKEYTEGDAKVQPDLHAEEDGRNREWEDRARINLEDVPEGTHTNIERDFEPEQADKKSNPKDTTAY